VNDARAPAAKPSLAVRGRRTAWLRDDQPSMVVTTAVFTRALGVVYLVAFLSLRVQLLGLFGSTGILPIAEYLPALAERFGGARWDVLPTLLWLGTSDAMLLRLCDAGIVLAALATAGIAPGPSLLALWALYLSFVTAGRVFLSFQWDTLLLEAGLLAIFVAPWSPWPRVASAPEPSRLGVWLVRWLLFRLMFASGVVKLLHDDPSMPTWHELTALAYHYETQCLPPWTAWYAHHLPLWWHRVSCALMFVIELVVPFLIFGPRAARLGAAAAFIGFQLLIVVTGNYTFFNWLTMALALMLCDDRALAAILLGRVGRAAASPLPDPPVGRLRTALGVPLMLLLLLASTATFARQMGGNASLPAFARPLLQRLAPLRSVNGYGLFARMTTVRNEIVIEGSADGGTWLPYEFPWKPGDVMRRPTFVAPHQPRLDWQMWFAALTPYRANPEQWFARLLGRVLDGEPTVLALFAANPFADAPPRFVRAVVWEYHFSAPDDDGGAWWRREWRGIYAPAIERRQ
jgi:hypothetical protein